MIDYIGRILVCKETNELFRLDFSDGYEVFCTNINDSDSFKVVYNNKIFDYFYDNNIFITNDITRNINIGNIISDVDKNIKGYCIVNKLGKCGVEIKSLNDLKKVFYVSYNDLEKWVKWNWKCDDVISNSLYCYKDQYIFVGEKIDGYYDCELVPMNDKDDNSIFIDGKFITANFIKVNYKKYICNNVHINDIWVHSGNNKNIAKVTSYDDRNVIVTMNGVENIKLSHKLFILFYSKKL